MSSSPSPLTHVDGSLPVGANPEETVVLVQDTAELTPINEQSIQAPHIDSNTSSLDSTIFTEELEEMCRGRSLFSSFFSPEMCVRLFGVSHTPPQYPLESIASLPYVPSASSKKDCWQPALDRKLRDLVLFVIPTVDRLDAVDWEQISKSLSSGHNARECYSRYVNVVDPRLSTHKWHKDEESLLKSVVEDLGDSDWIAIAETFNKKNEQRVGDNSLGCWRSPIACLRHWKLLSQSSVNGTVWTKEEEERLAAAVERYGLGNWTYTAAAVGGHRTVAQCKARWRVSSVCRDDVISGRWLPEEEKRLFLTAIACRLPTLASTQTNDPVLRQNFIEAVMASNTTTNEPPNKRRRTVTPAVNSVLNAISIDSASNQSTRPPVKWTEVASFIPGKTDVKVREKWTNTLDPTLRTDPFSAEENEILTSLVNAVGTGSWSQVSRFLPGRTDAAVKAQWHALHT